MKWGLIGGINAPISHGTRCCRRIVETDGWIPPRGQ